MIELLRAAWALIVDNYQDELEDPIGHHQREKAKLRQLSAPTVENLFAAHDAYVAEIRKRRAESPWKGPFDSRELDDMFIVSDSQGLFVIRSSDDAKSEHLTEALNLYLGYTPSGEDVLKGLA